MKRRQIEAMLGILADAIRKQWKPCDHKPAYECHKGRDTRTPSYQGFDACETCGGAGYLLVNCD